MDHVAVFGDEAEVASLKPDLDILKRLPGRGVIVTALEKTATMFSAASVPRSAFPRILRQARRKACWPHIGQPGLAKETLLSISFRHAVGEMSCKVKGNRIEIAGHAALYLSGNLSI